MMRKRDSQRPSRFTLLLAAGFAAGGLFAAPVCADDGEFVAQQALVRLANANAIGAFNARNQTTTLDSIANRNVFLVRLRDAGNEPSDVQRIRTDPAVISADLNYIVDENNPGGTTQSIFLFRTQQQYRGHSSYAAINADAAQARATGAGIVVAIVDSGLDVNHPELAGRIAPGGFDFISNQAGISDVGDGVDSNNNGVADEFVGHGTLVGGVIARVAPGARILPIRVMDSDGDATTFRLCEGIYHAIDNGAHVINLSLGTTGQPSVLRDAVEAARVAGVSVVAAAGNDNASDPPRTPAGFTANGVIAVAATTSAGERSEFTNFGSWISLSAPGAPVISTVPNGLYGEANGTSFAAPMVSASIALVRSLCPTAPMAFVHQSILHNATPIAALNPGHETSLGRGLVNASAAVNAADASPVCGCLADWDRSGTLSIQDVFTFLDDYFTDAGIADTNSDGIVSIEDLFGFLETWFTGC